MTSPQRPPLQDPETLVDVIVDAMQDQKAKSITVMDLRSIDTSVCEFFVICSGESSTQVNGIADRVVEKTLENLREKPWHQEGKQNGEWILLDYVNVVVHIFYREVREFYNLEELWADADTRVIEDV